MKVRANHNLNYNGTWHVGGDEIEIDEKDYESMKDLVTVPGEGEFVSDVFPPEETAKTNRKRKE